MSNWIAALLRPSMSLSGLFAELAEMHDREFGQQFIMDVIVHIGSDGCGSVDLHVSDEDGSSYVKRVMFETPEQLEAIVKNPPVSNPEKSSQ